MNLEDIELPSNLSFGLFFSFIFFTASIFLCFTGIYSIGIVFMVLATVFLSISYLRPQFLLPLNKLWMRFGILIGKIVSPIVLGVIFFCIFTPIALLMRLFGRDELMLKLKDAQSFWKARESDNISSESFKNQF